MSQPLKTQNVGKGTKVLPERTSRWANRPGIRKSPHNIGAECYSLFAHPMRRVASGVYMVGKDMTTQRSKITNADTTPSWKEVCGDGRSEPAYICAREIMISADRSEKYPKRCQSPLPTMPPTVKNEENFSGPPPPAGKCVTNPAPHRAILEDIRSNRTGANENIAR